MEKHRHLNDETINNMLSTGEVTPAIRFMVRKKRWIWKEYSCTCGEIFSNYEKLEIHNLTEQTAEIIVFAKRRYDLTHSKALYWRRRAYVLQYGSSTEKRKIDRIESPEMANLSQVRDLVERVTEIWSPLYLKRKQSGEDDYTTVGQAIDEMSITDESPLTAAKDMDDKFYSHTNSRGVTYILHKRDVVLRDGKRTSIYYFRKEVFHDDVCAELPEGYVVRENLRNGFLTVVRGIMEVDKSHHKDEFDD